jgi:formate dehydrogenase gamma subunit
VLQKIPYLRRTSATILWSLGLLSWSLFCACIATASAQTADNDKCFMCHGREGGRIPFVARDAVKNSAHGKINCVLCHRDAGSIPHPQKLAPVSCSRCHSAQSGTYMNSRHGRAARLGRTDAEVCSDCHGKGHEILTSKQEGSPVFRTNIVNTCARCHADTQKMQDVRLAQMNPVRTYRETVHGQAFEQGNKDAAVCTDCHGTHNLYNALNPASSVYRKNIPDTCGKCHGEIALIYRESVHGTAALAGVAESPVCIDCHGNGHSIRASEESELIGSGGAVTRTCSSCHESMQIIRHEKLPLDRLSTYQDSYHGLAARRGDSKVANCASCHGYHDVLPSNNPRSSVNAGNLAKTCGQCHPGAGNKISLGNIHGSLESKHWSLFAVQWFYWIVIPLALGAMILHNGLDWLRKVLTGTPTSVHGDAVRLTVNERLQHFVLIVTFILLALSGFALKFPDALWANYLAPSNEAMRRSVHRWSALVFTLLSLYHFAYMILSARGRFILSELLPRWADIKDVFSVAFYNLGIRKTPPDHSGFYRYPEKIEYWSLVWGTGIMVLSGALLVFNNFTLRYFPLWVSDLATLVHYYEAILACMAIVIWHFYGAIFDPDVYPMNCAWLTGRVRCGDSGAGSGRVKYYRKIPYGRF